MLKRLVQLLPALFCLGALTLIPKPGEACIHPPKGFKGIVDSGAQRGLIFWENGRQELVIQPGYTIDTAEFDADEVSDDGLVKDFDSFAWVLPLPSLPDSYAEVEPDLFTDIAKFTEVISHIPEPEKDDRDSGPIIFDDSEDDEITFFEPLEVGDYEIQPIKAKGAAAGEELKGWLKDKGFGELDDRVLRFYLEREFYWLAVKLVSKGGLPADGSAKPLHVSFKSAAPTYPWKIYDKTGEFDLELWVITREAIDLTKSRRFGLLTPEQIDDSRKQENRNPSYVELPESVRAIADESPELKALRLGKVFVYRMIGRNIETEGGFDLALLQEELFFEFEKDVADKPKEEVKPTVTEEEKDAEGEEGDEEGGAEDKDTEKKPEDKADE